ncbi:sigma-54-dependent transcriptional regulator [Corallococcus carmarthensis]|uniref:Sigma-54-dependent Fis family transcriptional regulator n=1 Tax=Corallococcus carmarthensis TaxID=2316728 RepID=A0A3A8K8N2_9BACT|nr:sigma-54 dependent transcriptional regulator [Corallococcus carmarthensis]NOK18044.1 sigma-54-dependent Fis family transcriptional regulator [Corallococcus carmarthensis]RKH03559.1 sigma-54-dependent Fis family transcriptional regulator [Corallococcus carmarthensis]
MPLFRTVLVADDEPSIRHILTLVLTDKGYDVRAVSDGDEALRELSTRAYDVLVTDVRMPRRDGLSVLKAALAEQPGLTVVVMSAYGSQEQALEAVQAGAYDYVQKPFKPEELVLVLRKAEERERLVRENRRLHEAQLPGASGGHILGRSAALHAVLKQVSRVAPVDTTVLISGESGTGKELIARELHGQSRRAAMPFVAVNCGAIPHGLLESELFGHAKGAFTDARTARRGLFAEADGGTLFLDEVGELPLGAQVKLLRVLQEGEIRPVGESRVERVDVRVVAATLRDLGKLVEKGEFREDLYYRLNVVNLTLPPLRERREDIPLLARAFLHRFNRELNRDPPVEGFAPEAEALMTAYAWPGNVRELENAMERAVLLAEGTHIAPGSLPEKLWAASAPAPAGTAPPLQAGGDLSLKRAIRELEESYIRAALRRTKGNRTRAAEVLDISHRALLYKIKEYGIDPDAEGTRT